MNPLTEREPMKPRAEMAAEILDDDPDTKATVISMLAEFFQDSFREDPVSVGDWLTENKTSVDLFIEMVAVLRSSRETTHD